MFLINLLLILAAAFLISCIIDKETDEVLAPLVFFFLLVLYLIAIAGKAHHSYEAGLVLFVLLWIFYIIKKRRFIPALTDVKKRLLTPGLLVLIGVVLIMFVLYSNHFITVWDDFHYNATLPKDMFYYGTLPTGNHSATLYRSYLPLMQLFFYWGFQGAGRFSEPAMFGYKLFLIYTCMLPLFRELNKKRPLYMRIFMGFITVIMPYLLMFELLESLSMDTFMAMLFSYSLYHIVFVRDKDLFTGVKIMLSLTCLTMVKQLGILFTLIALMTWFMVLLASYVKEDKDKRRLICKEHVFWLASGLVNALFFISWKVFCNKKGNSVYLSGKLKESVSGSGIAFPSYTQDTVKSFVKSFFTYSLDLAPLGLSLFAVVVLVLLVFIIRGKGEGMEREVKWGLSGVFIGLILYLPVLIYTYLFVFEDWEAESLSSIDRYFGTYGLALLFLAAGCIFMKAEEKRERIIILTASVIFLVCAPWGNLYRNLIPPVYLDTHRQAYDDINTVRSEMSGIRPEDLEVRTVMVVTSEGNSIYSRGTLYNFIPLIPAEYIIEDPAEGSAEELLTRCSDSSAYYVYFSNRLIDDEDKMASISGALDDGFYPEKGGLYYYDKDKNRVGMRADQ